MQVDLQPEPDVEESEVTFQHQDPRAVRVEKIGGWIFTAILVAIALGVLLILAIGMSPIGILFWSIVLGTVLFLCLIGWGLHAYPDAAHRHYLWRFGEKGLEIHKGVWFRREITVPRFRVQHTDVHQGPLMRKFGLAKLIVHTAGTRDATVELEGLAFETAHSLRDALIADRGNTPNGT